MKFCNKCQENTERNNSGQCKPCRAAASAAYRVANPEEYRKTRARYRAANKEKTKVYASEWRRSNPEEMRARVARYYAANKEKCKLWASNWSSANPEKRRMAGAKWNKANPKKKRIAYKKWRKSNPEAMRIHGQNRRALKLANGGVLSKGLSEKLFKLQKGKCPCCSRPLGRNFHLDHIVPIKKGGPNEDWNIQLLRQQCNNQKSAKDPIDFMQSRGFLI